MDVKKLYKYQMNDEELRIWGLFQSQIRKDCQRVNVSISFTKYIETQIDSKYPYSHTSGYCTEVGYFYVAEGDFGELFLECLSQNREDIRWYITEIIFSHIGQQLELEGRENEEKRWRYQRKFKKGKLKLRENKKWIYNAVHDNRKYWFEYTISALAKIFDEDRVQPYVSNHITLMNRWFYDTHWDFDWENMCFIEVSDSKEHD